MAISLVYSGNGFMRLNLFKSFFYAAMIGLVIPISAHADTELAVEEMRSTLVGVMEALVQKGVLTKEQAQQIVDDAQAKTEASVKSKAAQEESEKNAVRVNYVPENVKDEIKSQVATEIRPSVVKEVVAQAKNEKWGIPAALPDWISNLTLYGDVRVRAENADYASDNAPDVYLNFDAVNSAGGIGKAGTSALLNVSEDRFRIVNRLRVGVLADLGSSFTADLRLTSGIGRNVNTTNQTLGSYNARGSINVDKAAVTWDYISPSINRELEIRMGRFSNPYTSASELVWDNDLTFEGISATYALDLFGLKVNKMERSLYFTLGAMPLQEVELSKRDKWLYAVQSGLEMPISDSSLIKFSAGYFNYRNISGIKNSPDSTLLDYTAPKLIQKGNTLFDIRNSTTDTSLNLFALAANYRLINVNATLDFPLMSSKRAIVSGEFVRNIGYKQAQVFANTGYQIPARVDGYDLSFTVGDASIKAFGKWKASFGYRYLQRDAVLDAFTDSDFRLGGTDSKGYQIGYELGLSKSTSIKARLMSASEIDGPPLAIDVYQLDLNSSF